MLDGFAAASPAVLISAMSTVKILYTFFRMSSYQEAYEKPPMSSQMEKTENPQSYVYADYSVQHVKAARHILGLVGGNEVSGVKGNATDVESDLRGITRPTTRANSRQHQPLHMNQMSIERTNAKYSTPLKINIEPAHLPTYQLWAYPATFAPEPFKKETCQNPEKF